MYSSNKVYSLGGTGYSVTSKSLDYMCEGNKDSFACSQRDLLAAGIACKATGDCGAFEAIKKKALADVSAAFPGGSAYVAALSRCAQSMDDGCGEAILNAALYGGCLMAGLASSVCAAGAFFVTSSIPKAEGVYDYQRMAEEVAKEFEGILYTAGANMREIWNRAGANYGLPFDTAPPDFTRMIWEKAKEYGLNSASNGTVNVGNFYADQIGKPFVLNPGSYQSSDRLMVTMSNWFIGLPEYVYSTWTCGQPPCPNPDQGCSPDPCKVRGQPQPEGPYVHFWVNFSGFPDRVSSLSKENIQWTAKLIRHLFVQYRIDPINKAVVDIYNLMPGMLAKRVASTRKIASSSLVKSFSSLNAKTASSNIQKVAASSTTKTQMTTRAVLGMPAKEKFLYVLGASAVAVAIAVSLRKKKRGR